MLVRDGLLDQVLMLRMVVDGALVDQVQLDQVLVHRVVLQRVRKSPVVMHHVQRLTLLQQESPDQMLVERLLLVRVLLDNVLLQGMLLKQVLLQPLLGGLVNQHGLLDRLLLSVHMEQGLLLLIGLHLQRVGMHALLHHQLQFKLRLRVVRADLALNGASRRGQGQQDHAEQRWGERFHDGSRVERQRC
jgi:hypothetical protein